jgi:YVTN family beta-propeller protein
LKPRREGLGRTALLGIVAVVLVLVIAGVFAVVLTGNKSTTSRTSTTSSTTSSTNSLSGCSVEAGTTIVVCSTSTNSHSTTGFNLSQPIGAAFDPTNGELYVTNNYTNSVSVINVGSGSFVTNIDVGYDPAQAAYDPVNGEVYVSNNGSNTVTAIDTVNNTVLATIQTGALRPDGIAVDTKNNCLYVAEHGNSVGGFDVTVINATTNQYVKSIQAIWTPTAAVYDPANDVVYATTGGSDVMVINTTTNVVTSLIKVGQEPRGIALDPDNGYLYVANTLSGTISVISTLDNNTVIDTINVSSQGILSVPYLVAYDPANGLVMVTNDYASGVNVINGTTLLPVISTGFQSEPAGLAYDSTDNSMYVVGHATNAIVGITAALKATYLAPPTTTGISSSSSQSSINLGD